MEESPNKYTKEHSVIELVGSDFNKNKVVNKNFEGKNALIKFYAPWCPHCTVLVEQLDFIAKNLDDHGFKVGAVNVTNKTNKEISQLVGITTIPAFYSMNSNGELVKEEIKGELDMKSILDTICNFTNKKTCCKINDDGKINC
tara:strand:- start:163 stop:591 length:429 start_codon:yes stop_codon:yes gene_type:complete